MKKVKELLNKMWLKIKGITCKQKKFSNEPELLKVFDNIIEQEEKEEQKGEEILKVRCLDDYRKGKAQGIKEFDFSELDSEYQDISDLDLENLNLNINLREILVYPNIEYGDNFVNLTNTVLRGNHVVGDLSVLVNELVGKVYYWYTENTFDENYKNQHPTYFLNNNAPEELKEKYYNPQKIVAFKKTFNNPDGEEITYHERHILSFSEYIKYYEFLQGKYLGNFKINPEERIKIQLVEQYGLERAKEIIIQLAEMPLPFNMLLEILNNLNTEELTRTVEQKNLDNNLEEAEQILKLLDTPQRIHKL